MTEKLCLIRHFFSRGKLLDQYITLGCDCEWVVLSMRIYLGDMRLFVEWIYAHLGHEIMWIDKNSCREMVWWLDYRGEA